MRQCVCCTVRWSMGPTISVIKTLSLCCRHYLTLYKYIVICTFKETWKINHKWKYGRLHNIKQMQFTPSGKKSYYALEIVTKRTRWLPVGRKESKRWLGCKKTKKKRCKTPFCDLLLPCASPFISGQVLYTQPLPLNQPLNTKQWTFPGHNKTSYNIWVIQTTPIITLVSL